MCTYETEVLPAQGSAKGAGGWFPVASVNVYFDHPSHAPFEHSLNVDFLNPALGASARVAVELDRESARELALAIERQLEATGGFERHAAEFGARPRTAPGPS